MTNLPLPAQLFQLLTGFLPAQAICAAAALNIPDRLADGPRPISELARQTQTNADALYRLLRTLASIGIFEELTGDGDAEVGSRRFRLTPMAELLKSDHPGKQHAAALLMGEEVFRCAAEMLESVKTGRAAWEVVYRTPLFEYLGRNPQRGQVFDAAMTGIHGPETPAMIQAYDFSGFETIVDVGGGNASLITQVLRASPRSRGIVFDLPQVVERTRGILKEEGLAERCTVEGGDFFKTVPAGGDAYILRHIIHDWDDQQSVQILRNCRDAAAAGGAAGKRGAKVLIVESVLPPGNEPHPGKWLDLIMLICPGGRERTAAEYERLLEAAGLKLTRIVPTASPVSVVEAEVAG